RFFRRPPSGSRLPRGGAALLGQGARAEPARARAAHRRVRSTSSTPGQRQRQGAVSGGEATEDRGDEEITALAQRLATVVVRHVVIMKRKQTQSPTRDRLPCAAPNHRT